MNGSTTPKRLAVSGINCIKPCAPLCDIALGLNALSAWITARTSASSTAYSLTAAATSPRKAEVFKATVEKSRSLAAQAKPVSIYENNTFALRASADRKSVVYEQSVDVRGELGGRRAITQTYNIITEHP